MKQVPYCGPINIRCPGDPARGICAQMQSGYYFYFFYQSYICGSCGSTSLSTANTYFQENPISMVDGFSEGSFYCMHMRIIVMFYCLKVVLLTECF
jgi:hypothetical protein